jgi:DNA-3-methyladenine glycosylase
MTLPLSEPFFARSADVVASALLGCRLVGQDVVLRIIETEAYRGDDTACHAAKGRTARTAPLFGPPGRAYVYLCYGIHRLVNVVCEPDGVVGAVLIRGARVEEGAPIVRARRRGRLDLVGPGKVGQALAAELHWSGEPLDRWVQVMPGGPRSGERVVAGPRVGIDYASDRDRQRPWRFQLEGGS